MLTEKNKTVLIISLVIGVFVIGILPWLFLIFEETKDSVKWLRGIHFQFWGWLLVLCFAGYALKEVRNWNTAPKSVRMTVIIFLLISLVWSLIWFFFAIFGYIISTIT